MMYNRVNSRIDLVGWSLNFSSRLQKGLSGNLVKQNKKADALQKYEIVRHIGAGITGTVKVFLVQVLSSC